MSSIEAERVIKAKQGSDCMGGHGFRSQNAATKGLEAGLVDAEMEGLNAGIVWGNSRGAANSQRQKMYVQSASSRGVGGGTTSHIAPLYWGKKKADAEKPGI